MSLSPRERCPRARSRWFRLGLVSLLLFCGCRQKTDTPASSPSAGPPYLELSAHPRVGVIIWVHPEGRTVLIELDPHVVDLPSGGRLISRDASYFPQAVLEVAGEADGAFQAAHVLGGNVSTGQGVVAPGPELQKWGEQLPVVEP